jgi:hypothetical protein
MDGWYLVVSFVQVGKFLGFLQPTGLKQLVEGVFSAPVNYSGTNYIDLYIFSLNGEDFILDILNVLILGQGYSQSVVAILEEGILDRFLLNLFNRLFLSLPITLGFLDRLPTFLRFWFCRLFLGLLSCFWDWGRSLFFDLSSGVTPCHDIADKDENFVILKRFLHGLNSEFNIGDLGLIETIDMDLALFDGFLAEEFRLFSFEYFFYACVI